ncbi:MAG TPA: hypothetical protein VIH90_04285 [Candidatus Saccharimonadales bacterium]
MKEFLALVATALIVIAYIPYIRDVLKKKTHPHAYSWFISGSLTLIAFGLQVSKGAGWGAVPTFVGGLAGLLIFTLCFIKKRSPITKSDTLFFLLALIAAGLWLIANQPVLSIILLSAADILSFIPTIRKSWKKPNQETVFFYFVSSLRFTLATIAVQQYSVVTVLYPAIGAVADVCTGAYLLIRRRIVKAKLL